MVVSTIRMSAEQYLLLGDDPPGVRLELVDGEIAVSPSPTPRHQICVSKLCMVLASHVDQHNLGIVFLNTDTVVTSHSVRRPDILYFVKSREHLIGENSIESPPDLAMEVVSPSSLEIDRKDKFEQYATFGVAHYWIVDPMKRTVDAYRLERQDYVATGSGADDDIVHLPPFSELDLNLAKLWRS